MGARGPGGCRSAPRTWDTPSPVSPRTVKHSEALGARYSTEERAAFHAVWRYAGYLMGIPETILFTDESHALRIYRIGSMCEPPPTLEAIVMTNALVNSAPLVAGIEDTEERKKLVNNIIYPVSRALIGNELADQLEFPRRGIPYRARKGGCTIKMKSVYP